ncbi:putative Ig domain-containing protein [bacterium]|nr:putative Ig domain-containing protein [bacterium]
MYPLVFTQSLISITDTNLLNGNVGVSYSHTFSATNFSGQTTWELVAGTLPAGLILNANGLLNGTPTTAGKSIFTVGVKDKIWDTSKEFTIDVIPEAGMIFSTLPCFALLLLRRNWGVLE